MKVRQVDMMSISYITLSVLILHTRATRCARTSSVPFLPSVMLLALLFTYRCITRNKKNTTFTFFYIYYYRFIQSLILCIDVTVTRVCACMHDA